MKVSLIVSKNSPYSNHAKSVMIRIAREIDVEYEVYEIEEGEIPVSIRGRELPCFLIDDKVVWEGKPSYEEIKKIIKKGGNEHIGSKLLKSIWGKK